MRKKITFIFVLIALIEVAGILIFAQPPGASFDGERISDPDCFALRFDRMNGSDSETMVLQEGKVLHVSWQIESGSVDIAIGQKDKDPVYRADGRPAGDKAEFYVEIPQTGSYIITVSAREAKGRIEFMKTENE